MPASKVIQCMRFFATSICAIANVLRHGNLKCFRTQPLLVFKRQAAVECRR